MVRLVFVIKLKPMIMKRLNLLAIVVILFCLSCNSECFISDQDKKLVEAEIHDFMISVEKLMESLSPDEYFNCFLHTDELAIATQNQLVTNPTAFYDTINVHMGMMEKQSIETITEKIFVINKEAAVISTANVSTITLKNGDQLTMPYAMT